MQHELPSIAGIDYWSMFAISAAAVNASRWKRSLEEAQEEKKDLVCGDT